MTIIINKHRRLSPRQRELIKPFEVEGYHDEFRIISGSNTAESDNDPTTFSQPPPQQLPAKVAEATISLPVETTNSFLTNGSNDDFKKVFYFSLVVGAAMMAGCFLWGRRRGTIMEGEATTKGKKKKNTFSNGSVRKRKGQEQGNNSDDETTSLSTINKPALLSCKQISGSVPCRRPSITTFKTAGRKNHPGCSNDNENNDDDDDDSKLPKQTISADLLSGEELNNGPPNGVKHMDSNSRNPIDNNYRIQQAAAVPKLITDEELKLITDEEDSNNVIIDDSLMIQKTKLVDILSKQVSIPRQSATEIKEEFRTEILANAVAYKQVLEEEIVVAQESGMQKRTNSDILIATLSLQAAMAKRQRDAQLQAEFRGYQFETYQREIDRKLDERRHLETVRSFREDKDWLRKIVQARDECVTALKVSLTRSFALLIGFRPMLTLFKMIHLWNYSVSYPELVVRIIAMVTACPSECSTSSPSQNIFQLGYWIQLMGAYYSPSALTSYVDGSYCLVYNAAAALIFLVAFGATSIFARLFSLPAFSTSIIVAFILVDRFSIIHFQNVSLVLLFTGMFAYCYLTVYFFMSKGTLQRGCTPENATVHKIQHHFLRARDAIEMLPFAVLLWHLASAAVMS